VTRRLAVPQSFTLRGKKWVVEWGKDYYGQTSRLHRSVLLLCEQESEAVQLETWVHELMHAAFPDGIVSHATEERIVQRWAKEFSRIVRRTITMNVKAKRPSSSSARGKPSSRPRRRVAPPSAPSTSDSAGVSSTVAPDLQTGAGPCPLP